MAKKTSGTRPDEVNKEAIDEFGLEYKLKMIAFQDEIFMARKKLTASENRLAELQQKLDNYLANKENQLSEVNFTAHLNAQRIEAQARAQTELIIMEIDKELRHKQKEMRLLQNRTHTYLQSINDQDSQSIDQAEKSLLPVRAENVGGTREPEITIPSTEVPEPAPQPLEAKTQDDSGLVEVAQNIPPQEAELTGRHKRYVQKNTRADRSARPAFQPADQEIEDRPVAEMIADEPSPIDDQLNVQPPIDEADIIEAHIPATILEKAPIPAASLPEVNEKMRLDAFVDVRYYDNSKGLKQLQHHALQVVVDVDVPEETYSVRYTKVSSDIVAALLHYDNIILNDVFPFNIIEPNLPNIALYFYNLLEDILGLMDLGLSSITVLEIPDINIQVKGRTPGLDDLLHHDKDIFRDLRASSHPQEEPDPDEASPLGRLNRLLKKRGL